MSSTITTSAYDASTKTWTVTKDGETFTVHDKNGNGIWDSSDTIKSSNGETLSAEDLYEAKYQANDDDGVTEAEMEKYAEFKRLQEARDRADTERAEAERLKKYEQWQSSRPKKKSFIEKITPWVNLTTQVAMGVGLIGTMFSGMKSMFGCCNDSKVAAFSNMANMSMMTTSLAAMTLPMMQMNSTNSMNIDYSKLFSSTTDTSTVGVSAEQKALDAFLKAEKNQESKEDEETATAAGKLQELSAGKESYIPDCNEKEIGALTSVAKDSYSEDDKAKMDKLTKYTFIPIELIGDGAGKLSEKQAAKVNAIVREYSGLNLTAYENTEDVKKYGQALLNELNKTSGFNLTKIIENADNLKKAIADMKAKQQEEDE